MKIDIEIDQEFTHEGITYTCVGHDEGMVWGVSNEFEESKPFDCGNCSPINKFNISNKKYFGYFGLMFVKWIILFKPN